MFKDPLLLFMLVIFGLIIILLVLRSRIAKSDTREDTIFTKDNRTSINLWQKIYNVINQFPVIKRYTFRVRKQLEVFFPDNEKLIVQMTCKIVLAILGLIVTLMVVILFLHASIYLVACCVLAVIVANEQILQMVINRNEEKLLGELDIFIEKVQFNFLQSRMIDEALQDSLDGKNKLIERHGSRILHILQSEDIDAELHRYIKTVSNKFLREFMCICITTYIYGDSEDDGQSRFLQSLKSLKSRIGAEKRRMTDIKFNFKFLSIICVAPIFLLDAISNWAISVIGELEPYYHGYYGLITTVVCFAAGVITYFMMNYLKDARLADISDHEVLNRVYKIPVIKKAVDTYYNNNYGKFMQHNKLLRQTGSKLNPNTLMVKRMIYLVVSFAFVVTMFLGMNWYVRNRINTQVTGTGSKSSMASETDSITMMLMVRGYTSKYLDYDAVAVYNEYVENLGDPELAKASSLNDSVKEYWMNTLIKDFKEGTGCTISDDVAYSTVYQYNKEHASSTRIYTAYLGTSKDTENSDPELVEHGQAQLFQLRDKAQEPGPFRNKDTFYDSIADDVINRVTSYQNAYFHWYHALIAVAVSVICFMIPYAWVIFTQRESQQLMEEEVMQFQALILILMPIQVMSTDIILDWMLKFSTIFRPSLHRCAVHLDSDANKAFNDLLNEEPYEPLQDIVRKLQMCDRVGVKKAFYNMEVTHNNFCDYRKQSESIQLAKNVDFAGVLASIPYMLVIMVYLAVPFIMESFGQLNTTMQQIGTL